MGETVRLDNVLIGEVWFCSGQSNMEMPLNGFWNCPIEKGNETIATAGEWKSVRMATIPKTGALVAQDEVKGSWKTSTPAEAQYFSPWNGIEGFEVSGADRMFHPAQATLATQRKCIVVTSERVEQPVAVRYCFRNFQRGNLKNHRGMPVLPFRTDNW